MKRNSIALLLGFVSPLFVQTPVWAQADSSRLVNTSTEQIVPADNFRYTILKSDPYNYDRLFSPFQSDSFLIPAAGMYRFGMNAYQQVANMPFNIPQLDTNIGVSRLSVILGTSREQLLFLDHKQKISKRMTGYLNYNSLVSPGFMLNCLAKTRRFNVGLDFNQHAVTSSVNFNYVKIEADENGGIEPGQKTDGISKADYEQLQTFLSDDKRIIKRLKLELNNELLLHTKSLADSGATLRIKFLANAGWFKWGTSYTGTADSLFYPKVFKDSALTNDSSGYSYYFISPGLALDFKNTAYHIAFKAGVDLFSLDQRIDSVKSGMDYFRPFAEARYNAGRLKSMVLYRMVQSNGTNDGDYSLTGTVEVKNVANELVSSWKVTAGIAELAAEATSSFYISNHFVWENNFTKENFKWACPAISLFSESLVFSAGIYTYANCVYFNHDARPVQADKEVTLVLNEAQIHENLGKWDLSGKLRYALVTGNFIRIPEWAAYGRVSYQDRFFKNALLAEFGLAMYSTSAWNGYAFMPATGALFLQSAWNTGGVPTLDLFVNAGIGKARLTLMLQRVNYGLFGGEYFLAPGYPAPPRTLKFGVIWPLVN